MNDLISKSKLIEEILEEANTKILDLESGITLGEMKEWVENQPAVESPTWIPCSERLPKSEDKYGYVKCNVTVIRSHYPTSSYDICDEPYDEYFVADAMYDVSQKIWHLGEHTQLNALIDIEDLPLNCDYVIAWKPLPEPYKGETENDES